MRIALRRILKIRNSFLFVLILIQILIIILSTLMTHLTVGDVETAEAEKRASIISNVTNLTERETNDVQLGARIVVANQEWMKLLAAGDRAGLLAATEPLYKQLSGSLGIKQFSFYTPDLKTFLRDESPALFGDDVTASRPMLVACMTGKAAVAGLEQGRTGYGFRAVVPALYNGVFIGCFEMGAELDTEFLRALNNNFPGKWAIANLDKGTTLTKDQTVLTTLNEPATAAIRQPDYETPEDIRRQLLTSKPYTEYQREAERMQVYIPIRNFKGTIALFIRYVGPTAYYATIRDMITRAALISIAGMLLIGLVFWALYRGIRSPIRALVIETEKIKNFDLKDEVAINASLHELNQLITAVSSMKLGLQSFQKYVPADLVRQLIDTHQEARIGGKLAEMTVFFSDVADFTNITEDLAPNELTRQLSEYFEVMTEVILRNRGTVDKYIGDAVMAFWGAPIAREDHALLACRAAIECQRALRALAQRWKAEDKYEFRTRIGLCTGEIIVGNVGSNERLNYSVIGDPVNLASRLEGLNKVYKTSIIISEDTWLRCADSIEARLLDFVAVKGKAEPVRIYELIGEKGDISPRQKESLKLFSRALDSYLRGEWHEAVRLFRDLLQRDPDDVLTALYIERCEELLVSPPGADWKGFYTYEHK